VSNTRNGATYSGEPGCLVILCENSVLIGVGVGGICRISGLDGSVSATSETNEWKARDASEVIRLTIIAISPSAHRVSLPPPPNE